jgi:hypothetical protein
VCAQECNDRCYQKEPSTGDPLSPICTAVESAHETGAGGTCETCHACLQSECFYFRDKCEQLIQGEVKGSPVEWTQGLETCGSGLPLGNTRLRSRQLFTPITNDGLGTPRSTWCECARNCDDSCNVQVALEAAVPVAPSFCWGSSGREEIVTGSNVQVEVEAAVPVAPAVPVPAFCWGTSGREEIGRAPSAGN